MKMPTEKELFKTETEIMEAREIALRVHQILNYLRDRDKHEDAAIVQTLWEYAVETEAKNVQGHGTG